MSTQNSPSQYGTVATALAALQQGVAMAASARLTAGPAPRIVGASKSQPEAVIVAAIEAGLTHYGENKVQEAQAKWPALKASHPGLCLHLFGPLQSNKAEDAVALFDVIETIDRPKIADAIASASAKLSRQPVVLIQVNTGEEAQKSGIAPRELAGLVAHCRALGLKLEGLMCVPPAEENPAPHFALLQKLAAEHGLGTLSMGMSGDYEAAVRLGATHVRLGTALFGARA